MVSSKNHGNQRQWMTSIRVNLAIAMAILLNVSTMKPLLITDSLWILMATLKVEECVRIVSITLLASIVKNASLDSSGHLMFLLILLMLVRDVDAT